MINERSHRRPQFGLAALILIVTACGTLFAALYWFGPRGVVGGIRLACMGLAILVIWAWAYTRLPELTRIVTLGIVLGGVLLCLLAGWLHQTREASRRTQTSNELRKMGVKFSQDETFHPQ